MVIPPLMARHFSTTASPDPENSVSDQISVSPGRFEFKRKYHLMRPRSHALHASTAGWQDF
jgi:hypothetical protein